MTRKQPSDVDTLQKKIDLAQEAVSKMTDESLKKIAFQTVLQSLLRTDDGAHPEVKAPPAVSKTSKTESKPKAKQPRGPKGRVEELIDEGFFGKKRTIGDVKTEMENHGWFHRVEDLNPTLLRLIKEKKLRRIKEPVKDGGKLIWRYSKW